MNQPWMDQYLRGLQATGHDFYVLSNMPRNQQSSVATESSLLDAHVYLSETILSHLVIAFSSALTSPLASFRFYKFLRKHSSLRGMRSLVGQVVRSLSHDSKCSQYFNHCVVAHAHSDRMAYDFLPLLQYYNVPLVLTFHGLDPVGIPRFDAAKRQLVFDTARCVIVNTEFAKKQVVELGCSFHKIYVLPQGIDTERFIYRDEDRTSELPLRIISVGRFHRDKGQRYSLLAAKRLLDKNINFSWDFIGVGPEREQLQEFSKKLGLIGCVRFIDNLDTACLKEYYAAADVFVLASVDNAKGHHVETQGVVIQEAQSSGCCVIATRVGGIPECIENRVDGLLVKARNHREIADAICELLEDKSIARNLRAAALDRIEKQFASKVIATKMDRILRKYSLSM